MVEFEYTPRVAQETAGLGFSLPLPQRQVGVDVRNANPNTRAAMAQAMPFYETAKDIDPTLTTIRDAYIADVQGLNEFVQEAVSLGYDPRTIDYQDPQSIEINKIYRQKLEPIKQKESQLRYAKPITERMRIQGEVYNPLIEDVSNLSAFGGAGDVVKAYNQSLSSIGYDERGIKAAQEAREKAISGINQVYAPYMEMFKDNPVALQALQTKYNTEINSLEQAIPKGAKPQRDELQMYYEKKLIDKKFKDADEVSQYSNQMQVSVAPTNFTVRAADGTSKPVLGLPIVGLGEVISPKKATARTTGGKSVPVSNQSYDRMAVLPMDKNGNAIFNPSETDDISGFGVFVVGKASSGSGKSEVTYDVYESYDIVSSVSNTNYKAVADDRRNKLQAEAQRLNQEYFGKSKPKAKDKKPAETTKNKQKQFDPNDPL